jgi:superfamily II DNA or RNA helicase
MMATPNAYWRFGFSGTPLARGDQKNILSVAVLGEVIYRVRAEDLIARGVLSRPRIKFLPVRQTVLGIDWRVVYQAGVVDSTPRNRVVVGAAIAAAKPCLLFVMDISHGRALEAMLRAAKQKVEFVWGEDSSVERLRAIIRLRNGDIDVLVTSSVFDTGVDIPELKSIVNAVGLKSGIKTLQRLGRGSRIADGKVDFEVIDIDDRGNTWLRDHSRWRRKAYESEGYEVVTLTDADSEAAAVLTSDRLTK